MAINFLNTVAVDGNVLFVDTTNDRVGVKTNNPVTNLEVSAGLGNGVDGIFISDEFAGTSRIANSKNPMLSLGTSTESGSTATIFIGANATPTNQDSKIEFNRTGGYLSIWYKGQGTYREHVRYGSPATSTAMTKMLGNIGIGSHFYTNDPTAGLDFHDSQGVKITSTQGLALSIKGGANNNNIFEVKDTSNNLDFVINSSGKAGIGTTNPLVELEVDGSIMTSGTSGGSFRLNSNSNTGVNNSIVSTSQNNLTPSQGSIRWRSGQYGGSSRWSTGLHSSPYTQSYINLPHSSQGGDFVVNIESVDRLTIDRANGNVRIGTTSPYAPTAKLHVVGTGLFTGLVSGITPVAAANFVTKAYVDNAVYVPTAPAAPTTVTTAVVGETIEVTFNESATSNIDYYQVWSADSSGNFGIIAQIAPSDFATTMTVVDTSFNVSGTMSYRIYAVKLGIYSTAATSTQAFSASALSVTAMTVVNLNTAYYIQYEKPSSRFIDNIEIYMDSQTTQAALNRSNASIVYSGQNASYMRNVGASNNFHQFWVEVTTT